MRVGATVNSCLPMSAPARKTGAHAEKAAANRPAEALLMTAVSERVSALFSVLSAFCMGFPGFKLRLRFVPKRSAVKPFPGGTENGDWLTMPSHYSEHTRDFLPGALDSHRRGGV